MQNALHFYAFEHLVSLVPKELENKVRSSMWQHISLARLTVTPRTLCKGPKLKEQ